VAIAIVFFIAGILSVGILMGLISLFTIYFFRDPERKSGAPDNAVLTPADGKILTIRSLKDDDNPLKEPAIKVSIFMSVFDVHVNRIPMKGRISEILYNKGKFFSANLDKASEQNENNRITLDADNGKRIVFVQIAGLVARRIVCWINEQDNVNAGQRYGLIRFGSRLDLYLPYESRITIQPRDRVKAGETIIGYLQ
jgi:phosphatidylserine decarboxylase